MEIETLTPARYASWVHILARDDDRGVRPLAEESIPLTYDYNPERTTFQFHVANSGVCDAFPTLVDWILCLGFVGRHGLERHRLAGGYTLKMVKGQSKHLVPLEVRGDVVKDYPADLACFPILFVRAADLSTPSPTREQMDALGSYVWDGQLHFFKDAFADLLPMAGFGYLVGTPFQRVAVAADA